MRHQLFPRLALAGLFMSAAAFAAPPQALTPLDLPGVQPHAGFDDMGFIPALDRVVVPGGISGAVFFIDPKTDAVSKAAQVAPGAKPRRGHDVGTTSAAYADGYLIASDHDDRSLAIVKASSGQVVARVPLESSSDYVRYVAPVNQVWVTEPEAHQIQVFQADLSDSSPTLKSIGSIDVPGGPEALEVDAERGRAYTNLWKNRTLAIDLKTRKIVARWKDGCRGPRGLALAPKHGLLFVGCTEGKAVALDLAHDGRIVASAPTGKGVDIIAWNPVLQHLYVPGSHSATLTVLELTRGGKLKRVAVAKTAHGSHCVATDGKSKAYVCDPRQGRILAYEDGR